MEVNEITAIEAFRLKFLEKMGKKLKESFLWHQNEVMRVFEIISSEAFVELIRERTLGDYR